MVIVYSTGCPQCTVLKEKLKTANIDYTEVTDKETILSKGFTKVPMLEVNGEYMDFSTANKWIKNKAEDK